MANVNSENVKVIDILNLQGSIQFRVTLQGIFQWALANTNTWYDVVSLEGLRGRSVSAVTVNTQNKLVVSFDDNTSVTLTLTQLEDAVIRAQTASAQATASAAAAVAVAQGTATARPSTRPTLLLDFANSRYLDPKISAAFSRNSIATYIDRNGYIKTISANKPRFQHDPVTKESLGLLVEPTATNLMLYSQLLTNGAYGKTELSIIQSTTEKFLDGNFAFEVIESANNAAHNFSSLIQTFVGGDILTVSMFVKRGSGTRHVRAELNTIDSVSAVKVYFDLTTSTYSTSSVTGSGQLIGTPKIEAYNNNYYRISFTGTLDTTSTSGRVQVVMQQNPNGVAAYQGDGVSSLFIYGVQVEKGYEATSYIPTTTTTVTRATDKIAISGALFSEIFPSTSEGTLFISAKKASQRLNTYKFYSRFLGDITAGGNNSIGLTDHALLAKTYAEIYANGVSTYQNTLFSVDYGTYFLNSFAWKTNDAKSYSNGVAGASDADVALPNNLNQFIIGDEINTIIKQIAFWPRRVSDSALQALTINGLFGKNPTQAPTVGDLMSAAFLSPYAILRNQGKNFFKINGTGVSVSENINLPFDFTFEFYNTGSATITTQPSDNCTANTDYALVVNVPIGKTLWYAITPIFEY